AALGAGTGMLIRLCDAAGVTLFDFLNGTEIVQHHDFGLLAGVDVDTDSVGNRSAISVRWTIERSGRRLLMLPGERLRITIRANLSGLSGEFHSMAQGYRQP
ncbi:hypothetical protein LCGC14_1176360, partial [marine sediment metagenome]